MDADKRRLRCGRPICVNRENPLNPRSNGFEGSNALKRNSTDADDADLLDERGLDMQLENQKLNGPYLEGPLASGIEDFAGESVTRGTYGKDYWRLLQGL